MNMSGEGDTKKRTVLIAVLIILAALLIGGGVWIIHEKNKKPALQVPTGLSQTFTTAREVKEDGWVYTFVYTQMKDPELNKSDGLIRYEFYGANDRYSYKGNTYETVDRSEDHPGKTEVNRGVRIFGEQSDAQKRDMKLIREKILKQNATAEELLALKEEDFEFEELDGAMFFRLMREALTSDPDPEPKDLVHLNLPTWQMLMEPVYIDGYKFQLCYFSRLGTVDVIYIDVLYKDENDKSLAGYSQLSDLVETGEATPEQVELYQEIQKTMDLILGQEDLHGAIQNMDQKKIAGVDLKRLYTMIDNIGNGEYQKYLPSYLET